LCRGPFEVLIKHSAADDNGDGEDHELRRYDLGGIEPLQSSIEILDLHDCRGHENSDEEIGDGESDDSPDGAR